MLSTEDLESLIAAKKYEINSEKALLGLSPQQVYPSLNATESSPPCVYKKTVQFNHNSELCDRKENANGKKERKELYDLEETIPADLDRYIRRYLGLPVMLKAGEYSPNNPLIRGERTTGDVLVGLGEYERRRNTLRKIRQQQYREYLDQQAKKKQEAKEALERERREREEREREREERERRRIEEELERSPERRRASLHFVPNTGASYANKVDTGVQVEGITSPLSVAVQTDDAELFRLSSPSKCELTEAERELSPRTVDECSRGSQFVLKESEEWKESQYARRRSYGDYDERTSSIRKSNRDKLVSDLRHTYMPSIFDADAIQLRNMQAEKEAAERRQFYQQELKNQIMEQQRIKEERKTREKMLEQAEMRRLEEQLRMLKVAQEREITNQRDITAAIKDHSEQYGAKRSEIQNEIDMESQKLRVKSQPTWTKRITATSKSETTNHKLPFFYPKVTEKSDYSKPYSINIPESSIFSSNYDVDSYLRRNLNFKDKIGRSTSVDDFKIANDSSRNTILDKPLIHERPKDFTSNYTSSTLQSANRFYSKNNSPNKKETPYIPRMIRSVPSGNNNFEDRDNIDDNDKIDKPNLKVKDKSPSNSKDDKRQYNLDSINNIDNVMEGNYNYITPKDVVTYDKDPDVIVRKRNANYGISREDMETSDNLDVQVKDRNDKYTILRERYDLNSRDLHDKSPISRDRNDKNPISKDLHDKNRIASNVNDKNRISIEKNANNKEIKDKIDKNITDMLPIPILRHSPKIKPVEENTSNMSDAMKLVEDKWKVPAVQKNILKNISEDGKSVSILTQLGSIRRQLQLEQLKLDKMLTKDNV